MTALACQIMEPPGNVVRVGIENASQIQRQAAATVKFIAPGTPPTGAANLIDPNTPAIPWTSGFGNGDPAPTTPGTVDVTTFAGRWVTFILAGSDGSTQPMYVTQIYNWPQVAGPAGGRTVIPLDVWELHSWRYAGYEFLGDQATRQQGVATCTVPVNSDTSTPLTVTYPTAYPTAGAPTVLVSSSDVGWIATWSAVTETDFVLTLARRIPLQSPEFGTASDTIASGTDHQDVTVTFPTAYQSTPVITANVDNASCRVTVQSVSTTTATLRVTYVPTAGGAVGDMEPISPATDVYATANSGMSTDQNSDGTDTGASSRDPTVLQHISHAHTITNPGTDATTQPADPSHNHGMDHTHPHNASGGHHTHPIGAQSFPVDNHHHDFTGSSADAPSDTAFTLHWVALGTRAAPSVTKDASWLAAG